MIFPYQPYHRHLDETGDVQHAKAPRSANKSNATRHMQHTLGR